MLTPSRITPSRLARSRITSSRLALFRIGPERAVLYGAVLAALAYCQDVRYDFILDDVPLILMNETIASWHNWKTVFVTHIASVKSPVVPLAVMAVHYRPVYILWQMLNEQIFGSVLPWWHATSLLLHLGVIFLVYQVGLKLLKERWTAALAALLFAFHPIHVESVSYVTASTDLLVTLFALVAFLAYAQFREDFLLSEIAGIELKNSQADAAAAHLHEALQIAPQMVNYHAMLAEALNLQGRTVEAEEQMRLEAGIRENVVHEQRASRE